MLRGIGLLFAVSVLCGRILCHEAVAQLPVKITLRDGSVQDGRLKAIRSDHLALIPEKQAEQRVPLTRILSLAIADTALEKTPPVAESAWLFLSSGDWLRAEPQVIDDESLTFRWSRYPAVGPVQVSLEVCRGIMLTPQTDGFRMGRDVSSILERRERSDLLTLRNGDVVNGEFRQLRDASLLMESVAGPIKTELRQARMLALNPDLISKPEEPKSHWVTTLRDGSTLRLIELRSDGDVLIGKGLAGYDVSLPLTILRDASFYDDSCRPLTRLPAARFEFTPFLSLVHQPLVNRSIAGGPLMVRKTLVSEGLGMSSGTLMEWTLNGQWSRFLAGVAVDDSAAGRGSVRFEVRGDGKQLWRSGLLTGQSDPVSLPVLDISGMQSLTLIVDMADGGNALDHADWLQPVLIK